ncbi:lipid II flippase MurJ [Rhodovibrio salinarum]|uniref:Peptidoglycan lipid II flippase n=1 Tax=Rhodovibrio salinarum TaxID=1087 RepID=A0A934QHA2_9PROT|nr:lipid II flippase MurJ [Rhodovibrio salinarum]MBK1696662.1 hypothetical protein [Rhodovibrio salinarum]
MSVRIKKSFFVPILVTMGLVAGFFREILIAYYFGTSREVEIFRVAFALPSILSESIAVSVVSVLIRNLVPMRRGSFMSGLRQVVWGGGLIATGVTLLGIVSMPAQALLLAPGISGAQRELLVMIGRICWVMSLFVIMALPLRALMSVRGRVWPGASSTFVRSAAFGIVMIALITAAGETAISFAASGAVAGGLAVLVLHALALAPTDRRRIALTFFKRPSLDEMYTIPAAVMSVIVTQLFLSGGRMIDRAVASTMHPGTLAAVEYSYAILMAAAAILATSSNIVLAPKIAKNISRSGMHPNIPRQFKLAIFGICACAVLIGLSLTFLARPVVSCVLERGAFTESDTILTAEILSLHALALGPLVCSLILTQIVILRDMQGYLLGVAVVKFIIKAVALAALLEAGFGAASLPLSLLVAECCMMLSLFGVLARLSHQRCRPV